MTVTFGLAWLPLDAYDDRTGAAHLAGYDRAVELLGPEFTTLWSDDHFQRDDQPVIEGWTRLCYLATRFEQFKVGSLVIGQGYRNPALLAKMAATLQFLSDGRLVLGIGAGWKEDEYRAYGYGFPSPRERVEQLEEALTILRLLWQGGPVTFRGRHYSVIDAYCTPVPTTPIPIMVGSAGRRVVRLAAEHADGWNWDADPDTFDPAYARLLEELRALGRPSGAVEITAGLTAYFPEDPSTFVGSFLLPGGEKQLMYGPTPQDVIDSLRRYVELGVTHFQVGAVDLRTLRLLAAEVAPALSGS